MIPDTLQDARFSNNEKVGQRFLQFLRFLGMSTIKHDIALSIIKQQHSRTIRSSIADCQHRLFTAIISSVSHSAL